MDPVERMLMDSGFETRETKKAHRISLQQIPSKVSGKVYNAKEILK